jgi:hypothetical protein
MDQVDDRHQYFPSAVRAICDFWVIGTVATGLLGMVIRFVRQRHRKSMTVAAKEPAYDTIG